MHEKAYARFQISIICLKIGTEGELSHPYTGPTRSTHPFSIEIKLSNYNNMSSNSE